MTRNNHSRQQRRHKLQLTEDKALSSSDAGEVRRLLGKARKISPFALGEDGHVEAALERVNGRATQIGIQLFLEAASVAAGKKKGGKVASPKPAQPPDPPRKPAPQVPKRDNIPDPDVENFPFDGEKTRCSTSEP